MNALQQAQNCEELARRLLTLRPEQYNHLTLHCDSAACAYGWAETWGMVPPRENKNLLDAVTIAERTFGRDSWWRIFGCSFPDRHHWTAADAAAALRAYAAELHASGAPPSGPADVAISGSRV